MRLEIGYKFILGFTAVVAVVAFTPYWIDYLIPQLEVAEWLRDPFTILVAITFGLILGTVISKGLTKKIHRLAALANHIGSGDLTKATELDRKGLFQDEVVDLSCSLKLMTKNLEELIKHVKIVSLNVAKNSESINPLLSRINETVKDVKNAMYSINQGTKIQNQYMEKTAGVIKGINDISGKVAAYATDAARLASNNNQVAKEASIRATAAIDKFEKIFYGIDRAKEVILGLEGKVKSIPDILEFITHISRQTDLLALNAAIEASKAGEHGKGFANVADEVRRFADNTSKSSEDVASIVKDFRHDMGLALKEFMEGVAFIREGRQEIQEIQKALNGILEGIADMDRRAKEIFEFSQKQKMGVQTTGEIVKEFSEIAHKNLASTERVERLIGHHQIGIEEVAASFGRLHEMSQELEWLVMKFKTDDDTAATGEGLEKPTV